MEMEPEPEPEPPSFALLGLDLQIKILGLVEGGDGAALLRASRTCRWFSTAALAAIRRVQITPERRRRLEVLREEDQAAAASGEGPPAGADLSRFTLFGLLQSCPSLEILDLGQGGEIGSSLDSDCRRLEAPCAALRALRAVGCALRADHCLSLAFTALPALTVLDLSRNAISDRGLNVLLMGNLKGVERLVLADCDINGGVGGFAGSSSSASSGPAAASDCPLPACTHLDLSGNPISESFANEIPALCPSLETLLMGGCCEVYDLDLTPCQRLTRVSVKCMKALESLLLPPQQIRTLDLVGLQFEAESIRLLLEQQHGDELQTLLLAESMADADTVASLRDAFPSLINLDLRWCEQIGDEPEAVLLTLLSAPGHVPVESLLCRCLPLTDDALGALTAGVNGCLLRQLDVGRCDALTDATLGYLAEWACQLTHLNLEWCFHFTDAGVRRVMQRCTHLQFLKLEGCKQVTEKVLSLPELQRPRSEPWSPGRRGGVLSLSSGELGMPPATAAERPPQQRSPSPTEAPHPATELRLFNLVYVNNVDDDAIRTFSNAFPQCVATPGNMYT